MHLIRKNCGENDVSAILYFLLFLSSAPSERVTTGLKVCILVQYKHLSWLSVGKIM